MTDVIDLVNSLRLKQEILEIFVESENLGQPKQEITYLNFRRPSNYTINPTEINYNVANDDKEKF
jgi:hypothetical protein